MRWLEILVATINDLSPSPKEDADDEKTALVFIAGR